jgi:capsular polysaccharide biosynthesis protein
MSEQALDLKRSLQIVRQYVVAVAILAAVGVLAGAGYAKLKPPMVSSEAVVLLPTNTRDMPTQVLIAGSDHVLAGALRGIHPTVSLQTLRDRVDVRQLTSNALSVTAQAGYADQAEDIANAVADSYIAYVSGLSKANGKVPAQLLEPAVNATGTAFYVKVLTLAAVGGLAGMLVGVIGAIAIGRGDRRLRQRDAIADAIGVPVLASLPVWHPTEVAHWTNLLESYRPTVVHAWRLRNALQYLGMPDWISAHKGNGHGYSITVVTLASDRRALALGPQLAVFAASQDISTTLVLGPQQDTNAAATLSAACSAASAPSRRANGLQVIVSDRGALSLQTNTMFTVVVAVVDGESPRVGDTIGTTATVLGVSAGGATTEELARVAASAAAAGRQIEGILVADPDSKDHTTGRIPQLARSGRVQPTRVPGMRAESGR